MSDMPPIRICSLDDLPPRTDGRPRAVALGIFDGVHIGHRSVIRQAAGFELPDGSAAVSAVLTFVQPPWAMPKGAALSREEGWELLTEEGKAAVFASFGVEEWIRADFDELRALPPERFVDDILVARLGAKRVCCGFNYRFGCGGSGDSAMLRRLCAERGIDIVVAEPVEIDGRPVSSSRIRACIREGRVEDAARMLGRPFTIDFEVIGGQKLGRLLGTPTINQPLPPAFIRPRYGVYASSVEADGRVTHGVTNIGVRPTVGEAPAPLAETWIADFEGDLYGRRVPVSLIRFLRPETKFESVDALQRQILTDARAARRAVMGDGGSGLKAVLFDFDDTLQDRRSAFMKYCAWFFDKYFPDLPPEEKRRRADDMLARNNSGYVDYAAYFASLFEDWGWTGAPPVGEILREYQFRFPDFVTLFPETEEVLRAVRERGLLTGCITNGFSVMQNRKLDVSGLRPLLDIVVVSGDEDVHKPDPEIFRRAASRLGVACGSCLYVGDHPVNDVQGSRAAGMRPVFDSQTVPHECPPNTPEIRNLKELLLLID